jgi:hypothetical protein
MIHPLLIFQIPSDRLFDTLFKLQGWFPAELFLQLCRVDGVTGVVAEAVGDKGAAVSACPVGRLLDQ